jgi:hypothetical protein
MAKARIPLPTEYIDEYLELGEGGIVRWKKPPHPRILAGSVAGSDPGNGYLRICLQKKPYGYHRIVYYLAYGVDSLGYEIDHINRDPTDNRPQNLRLATTSENKWNTQKRNKTNVGHRGIRKRFWGASYSWEVTFRGKYVGAYKSMEEAVQAWSERAKAHAGEFYCHPTGRC